MMEVGSVGGVALTSTEILYTLSYEAPVVIAGVPSHNGDEEAVVRMRQMPSGGAFSLYLDIPNHGQGEGAICGGNAHASEAFSWLITDSGSEGKLCPCSPSTPASLRLAAAAAPPALRLVLPRPTSPVKHYHSDVPRAIF